MMTWRLWRGLRNLPDGDPIFRRGAQNHQSRGRWMLYLDNLSSLVVIAVIIAYMRASLLSLSTGLSPVILIGGFIILGGTVHGVEWTLAISDTVAQARSSHMLDLLSTTPRGAIGAVWSLALSQIHRASSFYSRYSKRRRIYLSLGTLLLVFIIVLGVMVLPTSSTNTQSFFDLNALFVGVLSSFALLAATYMDYIQSIVISLLTGMIAPSFSRQRFDAQVIGLGGFFVAQFGTYLVTFLVCFLILPTIGRMFDIDSLTLELVLLLPRLLVFFLIREALIVLLWRWLTVRYNEALIPSARV